MRPVLALLVTGATALLVACGISDSTSPSQNVPNFSHQFYDDVPGTGGTVCATSFAPATYDYEDGELGLGPRCQTSIWVNPSEKGLSVSPDSYEPVAVAFSRPVYNLVISTSGGVAHCGDPYGTVIAHRINGETVEIPLEEYPTPPGYCGYTWMSDSVQRTQEHVWLLKATVPDGAPIDRVVITPPGGSRVWEECATDFKYDPPRTDCIEVHAGLSYVVLFREFATDLNAGIDVSCAGSGAPRGSMISCQALPHVAGETLQVTGWTFTSDSNDVVPRQTDASNATWDGQLVVNGDIVVSGVIGGQVATGTATVTVTPRDWSTKTVRSNHTTPGPDGLPIRPWADTLLGNSSMDTRVRTDFASYQAQIADGGPNDGLTYMTDIPLETFTVARVNYPAMTQGSDWYLLQYPKDKTVGGVKYCGQPRVLTMPSLVEAHEGTVPANQPNSHIGIYINDVTRDARLLTEPIAGTYAVGPVLEQIHNAAFADSKAMDYDSRNNIKLPCVFKYFPPP